jgi:hypothetical protein
LGCFVEFLLFALLILGFFVGMLDDIHISVQLIRHGMTLPLPMYLSDNNISTYPIFI